jgi:hypothetical protein
VSLVANITYNSIATHQQAADISKRRSRVVTDSANSGNAPIGCHSDIYNRGHLSNRTCRIHSRTGTHRIYSNRKGNSRNRNIRKGPSPTSPEIRSRR